MVLEPDSHTEYSPAATTQTCMHAKVVQSRYVLRSQHFFLLPAGTLSALPRHLSPKVVPQFVSEVSKFAHEIASFLCLLRRRYPTVPSVQVTWRDGQAAQPSNVPFSNFVAGRVADVVQRIVHADYVNWYIKTESIKGKGVATYVTIWHGLGWCKDDMQGTVEPWFESRWNRLRTGKMYEEYRAVDGVGDVY